VPASDSSNASLVPFYSALNELPPHLRKKHLILNGLWYGDGKPINIGALLRCFIDEIQHLSVYGFQWMLNYQLITFNVDLLMVSVESITQAPLQDFTQINGHPGETCNRRHVYKFIEDLTLRTKEKTAEYATKAIEFGHTFIEVKGPSIFSELPLFNIIDGFAYDSQYGVDLGNMRNLASIWLDSSNSEKDWYIGTKKDEIDARLERFIPPSNLTRLPRTIYSRRHWKSSEWRNFLLFYGPLVLKRVLPEKYYNHFMLFSKSVYLLSQSKISKMEIFEAR
jgi:hypothetical protein